MERPGNKRQVPLIVRKQTRGDLSGFGVKLCKWLLQSTLPKDCARGAALLRPARPALPAVKCGDYAAARANTENREPHDIADLTSMRCPSSSIALRTTNSPMPRPSLRVESRR